MKRVTEMNRFRVGLVGTAGLLLVWALALNVGKLANFFSPEYHAEFAHAAGIKPGASVTIAGFKVGKVTDVKFSGDHVLVSFTSNKPLGSQTGAAIKTATVLGNRYLQLSPDGGGELVDGGTIPLADTKVPYDISAVTQDLAGQVKELDVAQIEKSLNTLNRTFGNSKNPMSQALTGVSRIAKLVSSRDTELSQVFRSARNMSGILAARNRDLVVLMTEGNQLMAMLEERRQVIAKLVSGAGQISQQLSQLVSEQSKELGPTFAELRKLLALLNKNRDNLEKALQRYPGYSRALSESLANGPYFIGYTQNLVPINLVPLLPNLFGWGSNKTTGSSRLFPKSNQVVPAAARKGRND